MEPERGEQYAVRCVLRLRGGLYEERITLWRAASFDEAIALAESEARDHARDLGGEPTGLAQAYLLADDLHEQGAEVFSLLRASDLPIKSYLDRHFDTGIERQRRSGGAAGS